MILQCSLEGEGFFRVGETEHRVSEGSALVSLLPEDATYGYPTGARKPWTFCWLNCYGDFSLRLWRSFRETFGPVAPLPSSSPAGLALRHLIHAVSHHKAGSHYAISEQAYRFVMCWWEQLSCPRESRRDTVAAVIRSCCDHYRDPISVKELAVQSNLSREHFTRIFRQKLGVSPGIYLRRRRLKAARDLLRSASLPLQEIALRSGFFSARQLSKAFQREYGKLPRRDGPRGLKTLKHRRGG